MIKFHSIAFLSLLFLVGGCALFYQAKIEVTRNPSPITEENEPLLRSIRSIAIPPFVDGKSVSEELAEEAARILKSNRINIEGPDKVKLFLTRIKKSMDQITEVERPKFGQRIGKTLKADGVIIGVILPSDRENNRRFSIELIQTSTGKILWWQVLELSVKKGRLELSKDWIIKGILADILSPLSEILGTSDKIEKPEPMEPAIEISPM